MQSLYDFIGYLVRPNPGHTFGFYQVMAVLFVIFLALGIYIKIRLKKHREDKPFKIVFKKYVGKFWTIALLIAIYTASRYYSVPFTSMRVVLYPILAWGAYLLFKVVRDYINKYPQEQKRYSEQMDKNKYLVKHK